MNPYSKSMSMLGEPDLEAKPNTACDLSIGRRLCKIQAWSYRITNRTCEPATSVKEGDLIGKIHQGNAIHIQHRKFSTEDILYTLPADIVVGKQLA